MARKKTRTVDGCTEAADIPEKYDSKGNCPHIVKGVDIGGLKKAWKKKDDVSCQLCKKRQSTSSKKTIGAENDVWVCMNCGNVGCGNSRHDHGMEHFNTPHSDCHSVVAVVDTWNVRCLQCRHDINLDINAKASDAVAYLKKNYTGFFSTEENYDENPSTSNTMKKPPYQMVPDNKQKMRSIKEHKLFPILGLENIGNTCYVNAVLQCLAQTPGFVDYLGTCCHSNKTFHLPGGEFLIQHGCGDHLPPLEGVLGEGGHLTKTVFKVLNRIRSGDRLRKSGVSNENPSEIIRLMKKLSNTFYIGEQHDTHELLRLLLEGLKTEDLKRHQRGILNAMNICAAGREVLPIEREFLKGYKTQAQQEKLKIEQIFGGTLVSILKCLQCNCVTTTFESFMDISLPVESEKVKNVEPATLAAEVRVSKYQQRKERKMARKTKKKPRAARVMPELALPQLITNKGLSSNESGTDSEADIEDNMDSESQAGMMQDDGIKTEATAESNLFLVRKYQESDLVCGDIKYQAPVNECDVVYPYTELVFGPSYGEYFGCDVNKNESASQEQMFERSYTPELRIVEPYSASDHTTSNFVHVETHASIAYAPASPEPSTNEDFGSCEGGRGSPASSIEQADWDHGDEIKKEKIPPNQEYDILAQGIEKNMQVSHDSVEIPMPEPFEYLTAESVNEEHATQKVTPAFSSDVGYLNLPDGLLPYVETSSTTIILNPGMGDKERADEGLSSEKNQVADVSDNDKHVIPDEAFESLVEEVVGHDKSDVEEHEEEAGNGQHGNNLSGSMDQSYGTGDIWGATLSPPSQQEKVEYSLEHCFRQFFKEEVLSGGNRIGCTQCTKRKEGQEPKPEDKLIQTNALKQLLFLKLPEVLTVHLKRFEVVGSRMGKINRKVSFPLVLDVSPYTSCKIEEKQPDAPPFYNLFAVIEHTGFLSSGHYTAYIKILEKVSDHGGLLDGFAHEKLASEEHAQDDSNKKWIYVSDTFMKDVSVEEVLSAEAYILFYRRV